MFAPTDEAFQALGDVQALLGNRQELARIIQYHMHHGVLDSTEIRGRNQVATVGLSLRVSVEGDVIRLNDAQITVRNIEASNGLIHVIDRVLDVEDAPRPETVVELLESDDRFLTFARLVRETNYDRDLSEEGPFTIFAPTDDAFDTLNPSVPAI